MARCKALDGKIYKHHLIRQQKCVRCKRSFVAERPKVDKRAR
jgi:hypothetical protein